MTAEGGRPAFYSRSSLNVETYDVDRELRGTPHAGDIAFFERLAAESKGPVLELGCGTGRVAIALAEAGFAVTGLDLSPAMLAIARDHLTGADLSSGGSLSLIEGNMASFELGAQFELVIIAFRSFQLLLTPEEERACLASVFRHLRPGGRLVVDVFDPLLDLLVPGTFRTHDPFDVQLVVHPVSGNVVSIQVVERTNHTLAQQLEETWRFTERTPEGDLVRQEEEVLRMRWLYRYEMRYLLELSGFTLEAEYADYSGSAPAYGKEQVWVARKTR